MLNKIEKYLATINYVLLLAILLAGYSLLCIAAYYSHPNAESFDLAADARNEGIFNSTLRLLVTFDGRYFTNVLHGLNPLAFGLLEYHKWMAVFSMVLFTVAFYFFSSAIFKSAKWYNVLLFSLLFLLVSLALSSSLINELYWMVSSFVYFYCWIFWFLWTGCFIRYMQRTRNANLWYSLSNIFLFLDIGLNEMFLVLNVITIGYLIFLDRQKNKVNTVYNLPIIVTLVSSVLLFVSSPGIAIRWYDHPPVDDSVSYWVVFKDSISHFLDEFLRLSVSSSVVVSLVFLLSFGFLNLKYTPLISLDRKQQIMLLVLCIVTLYLMTWGYYLPLGRADHPHFPSRIYASIGTGIILCLIFFVPFFLRSVFSAERPQILFITLLIVAKGIFFENTNIRLINEEYKAGLFHKHNEEMNKRYATINEAKNNKGWKVATVDTLSAKPRSIYWEPDIEANRDPSYWNQAYEYYFRINEIRLIGDTIFKAKF